MILTTYQLLIAIEHSLPNWPFVGGEFGKMLLVIYWTSRFNENINITARYVIRNATTTHSQRVGIGL
jgi:hypothetical protein